MNRHIAVVGGGIAGLTAALDLADAGVQVTVLDADRLGGKLRTSVFAGRAVDEGPDALLARVPDATGLAERVGIGDQLAAPATGQAYICLGNELVPLPACHVLGVPGDPDAADLKPLLGVEARQRLHADVANPGSPPGEGDETIGHFIRRRLGDDVADRLVGPLVGGINAGNIDELSMAAIAPQLDQLARSSAEASLVRAVAAARRRISSDAPVFASPIRGMASFVDAVVTALIDRGVELLTGVPVRDLERARDGWRVIADDATRRGVATETTVQADGVVIAAPAGVASSIVQDHAPIASAHLGAIRHASVAIVTLAFTPDTIRRPPDGSGFLVPRSEGLLSTAASWSSRKWSHLAPGLGDGTEVIRVSVGRSDDRRIATLDDAAIIETVLEELDRIVGLDASPRATRLTRWPSALPQYEVGHLDRVAAIEADLAEHAPGLVMAGCALRGVGIPASIRSGHSAAATVLATSSGDRRAQ